MKRLEAPPHGPHPSAAVAQPLADTLERLCRDPAFKVFQLVKEGSRRKFFHLAI